MAIGNADFTAREQKGFAFYFNCESDWPTLEPKIVAYLKKMGEQWRLEKNVASEQFRKDLDKVIADLKDDPTQMDAVKTVLGL